MSQLSSENYNWNGYQFEVEKYLNQLDHNPYKYELLEDLKKEKKKKLENILNTNILKILDIDYINKIFDICNTENKIKYFCNNLNEKYIELEYLPLAQKINIIDKLLKDFNPYLLESDTSLKPTKLRISTMTICAFLGCNINTKYFYKTYKEHDNFINPYKYLDNKKYISSSTGIIGCKAENYPTKGVFEKEKKFNFFNSVALNILVKDNKCINVKIFNNGKIQMTGVPDEETGRECIQKYLIEYIKQIPDNEINNEKIVEDKLKLSLVQFNIVMMNSDYFCGIEIQRENFYRILTERYYLSVSYESENYPGVKLEYFWNINNLGSENEGRCCCSEKCKGKGTGLEENNDCKKITISTFQSGKVIITGGRSLKQLNDAYNYINKIFSINHDYIVKKTNIKNKEKIKSNIEIQHTQFYFLKKTNIKNYHYYQKLLEIETSNNLNKINLDIGNINN